MGWLDRNLHDPVAVIGSVVTFVAAFLVYYFAKAIINSRVHDNRERYRLRQVVLTLTTATAIVVILVLWARLLQYRGAFFGLLGAGLAVAFKEPLLAIAGRIAILAGHLYSVGDRIEVDQITGDVIDIGFFYTRMLELGNWIAGDQATGRIVQFSNARLFGQNPVFNYTRMFAYIWDEVMLPITYASNREAATKILLDVGGEYTREFLQGAQQQLEAMQRVFLVPSMELKPQVYVKVTSNWVQLTMRYIVEPKKRRAAQTFIYSHMFEQLQQRKDISIGSDTMDLTLQGTLNTRSEPPQERKEAA